VSLLSGTCVAAHDTAATWLMNMLTASPLLISLLSTVAALPFFLLTLPAGAVADVVDRKKLLCVINAWLAVVAALLAILGFFAPAESSPDFGGCILNRYRLRI
jgi:MFS family permease